MGRVENIQHTATELVRDIVADFAMHNENFGTRFNTDELTELLNKATIGELAIIETYYNACPSTDEEMEYLQCIILALIDGRE